MSAVTSAAGHFGLAVGVLAHQFAFRLGAFGFSAFPVASGLFTNGFAFGFGGLL